MADAIGSRAARGLLFALAAGLVFQCLNVAVKALVLELPPMQAAWMRWIAGIFCITPFALAAGRGAIHTRDLKLHGLRSIFHSSGYALWYSAVGLIPLATTAALSFTGPLFVTLGAALFLGERVYGARWMGVLAGFVGVLVILRPGIAEPNPAALIMLAAVPLIACSNLVAKVAAGRDTPGWSSGKRCSRRSSSRRLDCGTGSSRAPPNGRSHSAPDSSGRSATF